MKTFILYMLLLGNSSIITPGTGTNTLKARSLDVDPGQSLVNWKAEKLTGTHTGTINLFLGRLDFQDNKLSGGYILLDMQSIKVADLSSPRKEQLESNLKGDNFFDTGRYTVARFDITSVDYADTADLRKVVITGILDMHGISRKISFKAGILRNSESKFVARADVAINRRDWNIATKNFKYNNFISPTVTLHVLLKAASADLNN